MISNLKNNMNRYNISCSTQLCIKNASNKKCLGYSTISKNFMVDYLPAYAQTQSQKGRDRNFHTLTIRIINRNSEAQDHILDGTKVHLINTLTNEYVACYSSGEIKFQLKTSNEEMNSSLYKSATWTVQCVRNINKMGMIGKQEVTIFDEICLKSVHGTYLSIRQNSEAYLNSEFSPERAAWYFIQANVQNTPVWVHQRTSMNKYVKDRSFIDDVHFPRQKKQLKSFKPQVQELLLIEDILDIMMGFNGVYIKKRQNKNQYVIEPQLQQPTCNITLIQLVDKILVLPTYYNKIEAYITKFSIGQGTICQALCGGLRTLIKQYKMGIIKIDDAVGQGQLTLQGLWFVVQGSIKILLALVQLLQQTNEKRGGLLIGCLQKVLNQNTDKQILKIYSYLYKSVMQIYIQKLAKWIYQGIIQDKYQQFMIKPELSNNSDWGYWQQKFSIRQGQIPSIFQREAQIILVTGKYLNILKQCGKIKNHPLRQQLIEAFPAAIQRQNFNQPIKKAYQWANQQLLNLVFEECKLMDVFKSIKGYFFLQYGDLFVHFMDTAEEDLKLSKTQKKHETKKSKHFSQEKIQNLFQLLIRTSSANNDPFKQQVSFRVQNTSIYDQMHRIKTLQPERLNLGIAEKPFIKKDSKYVDHITLDYKCKFPLNLIFNKKNMSKYQVMFRYMFECKFTQRQLNSVWLTLQSTKQVSLDYYMPAYLLNQKMLNYIKNLIYYLCYEVIEQSWLAFHQKIQKVNSFQEIIHEHNEFLNKCLIESLLDSLQLLTIITSELGKACQGIISVRNLLGTLIQQIHQESPFVYKPNAKQNQFTQRKKYRAKMKDQLQASLQKSDFLQIVKGYQKTFEDAIKKLLRQLNHKMSNKDSSHLINLLNRLDQQKYYNKRLFQKHQF